MTELPADTPVVAPAAPVIPWQRRLKRGVIVDYWRTVFHVIGRRGRLGIYMAGPVDYRSARKFRWLTILHALMLPLMAAMLVFWSRDADETALIVTASLFWRTGLTVLFLPIMTGIVSWFFCPRDFTTAQQNRSIALSYYTCAPLALWVFLMPLLLLLALAVDPLEHPVAPTVVFAVAVGAVELFWYVLVLVAVSDVARRDAGGVVATALLLPGAWLLVGVILFVLIPAAAGLLVLMWASLGP